MSKHRAKELQRKLHASADKIEPRIGRAYMAAVPKLRGLMSIAELTRIIHAAQVRRSMGRQWTQLLDEAMVMLPAARVKDAFAPLGNIVRDAFMRGAKIGSSHVNEVKK